MLAARIGGDGKETVPLAGIAASLPARLDTYHDALLARAQGFLDARRARTDTWDDFAAQVVEGWADALHCGRPDCEDDIKAASGATPRCIPAAGDAEEGTCIRCDRPSAWGKRVLFARAY
jgi:prolyl-tRNA synthetase